MPRNRAFSSGRNRLQIYLNAEEQASRSGRNKLEIYLNAEEQASRSGRNKLEIYLNAQETGVQEWKEQVVNPNRMSMSERNRLGSI
jgi:hypothetical protein